MSKEQECNQVLKGLCNCKCVKNGTYPCFIEKEFLLKQELKTAKEENEKLKKVADIAMKMKVTWDEFDKVNENEINTLTQQNKQLEDEIKILKQGLQ